MRLWAVCLIALTILPALAAAAMPRVQNGDFETAGDDPLDIPGWQVPNRAALGARVDGAGQDRDAVLALSGAGTAIMRSSFPVTTGEALYFTVDMRVVAGQGRAILSFTDIGGKLVGLRQYDVGMDSEWVTLGANAPIVVPAGALHGRITLDSFVEELAPGVPTPARQNALVLFDNVFVGN